MSPYLTPTKMENPIQTLPASPQLASQGYGGQLQSWSGSTMRQSSQSQSPNVDPYPQQMTRYYQGSYANHQHSTDMPQYVGSTSSGHHSASTPYNTQYSASRQNSYPGVNVQQTYPTAVKPNYGTYYNSASPQAPAGGYSAENVAQRQTNYTNSNFYSPQKSSQCTPSNVPQMPHGASQMPHGASQMSHSTSQMPHSVSQMPHSASQMSHSASQMSHSASQLPHSASQIPHSATQIPHSASQIPHSVTQMSHSTPQMPHSAPQMPHSASIVNSQPSYPKQPTPYQRYVNNYSMYQSENQPTNYPGKQLSMSPSGMVSSATVLPTMTTTQTNGQLSSIPTPPETSTPGEIPGMEGSSMDGTVDCIKSTNNSNSSFALPGNSASHTTSVSFSSSNVSISTTLSNSPENTRAQSWNTSGAAPPLQPPPNVDEGSQASSASASSSIPDEQNSRNAGSKPNFSYPPTPNTLSSPGAASMSSFHDDLECISSPGWPRTPASPVANNTTNNNNTNVSNNYEFANIKRPESLLKLYTLSDEPERRYFLDKLIVFNEDRGSPITQCPTISKQPLDVFRVYVSVKERGGFVEVTNAKRWKDIAGAIGVGASSSAAYTLRKQYMKLLLPFECKYDRGGIDPQPIINQVEASSRKKTKNAPQGTPAMYGQGYSGHPVESGYQPGYSECYPSSRYPCNSSTMDYRYVQNQAHYPQSVHGPSGSPVAGQPQYPQYARNSQVPCGSGNYYQGNNNAMAPAYNSPQHPTVNSSVCRYSMNSATSSPVPPTTESSYYPSNYASQQSYSTPTGNVYKYNYSNSSSSSSSNSNNNNSSSSSSIPPDTVNPQGSPVRTVVHRDQSSPYNAFPSTDVMPSEKVAVASENISQCKTETVLETSGNDNSQSSESNVSDTALPSTYNSTFVKKETVTQDSCTVAASSSPACPAPNPAVSPYQPPAVESNKAFPANCPSTPPNFSNHSSPTPCTPTYNQPSAPYHNPYHQKVPPHPSQFGQYVTNNTVSENYRGSEGPPPNFTQQQQQQQQIKYNGMASSKEVVNGVPPTGYPCTSFPPKTNMYPSPTTNYNHPQVSPSKEQYQMGFYKDAYNSPSNRQPAKGWSTNPCYSYQPTPDVPLRTLSSSTSSPEMKPFPEAPRPFPQTKCEAPPLDAKVHVPPTPLSHPVPVNRVQPPPNHMVPPHCFMSSLRKPMEFPADSIEAVKPLYKKRRRYSAKRVSPLDPWRLMLALKSGLLVESTWALDALSVLLCDNSSTVYFRLSHLPGLLSVLVEHYRRFLNKIFGLFEDLESECSRKSPSLKPSDAGHVCLSKEKTPIKNGLEEKKTGMIFNWFEKAKVLNTSNYTFKTRCKKNVHVEYDEALFLIDPEQNWDQFEGFTVKPDHWANGYGEITDHIQVPFETISGKVQFARDMNKENFLLKNESVSPVVVKDFPDRVKDCESSYPKLLLPSKGEPIVLLKKCHLSSGNLSDVRTEIMEEQTSEAKESSEHVSPNSNMENKLSFEDESMSLDLSKSENSSSDCKSESNKNCSISSTIECNPFSELQRPSDRVENETSSALDGSEESKEEIVKDTDSEASFPRLRCPSALKRPFEEELDEEAYCFDHPSLNLITDHQDAMIRRCMCVSNILRNLSFVPGNDLEMNKNSCFLLVLGRLLLLFHEHKPLKPTQRKYDKEAEVNIEDSCISLKDDYEWWQSLLHVLRDNTLVILSNIAGQLDLTPFPEEISLPLLDGLLHWVTCPSSYARDPIPVKPSFSVLTPQRLALEILCKLSVLDNNVDLMMATPPWSRIENLFEFLARSLSPVQDKVVREFSIVLLSSLSQADSSVARAIAGQGQCISYLIGFIEQAEASAFQIASTQGTKRLKDNPELVGTTPNMVLRAAIILKNLASVSENRTAFFRYQPRLLTLVTSQIIDQELAGVIAEVLFHCSGDSSDNDQLTSFSLS